MKKMLLLTTAAIALLCVLPAHSSELDDVSAAISAYCAKEWSQDYSMQLYCVNKQKAAYNGLHQPSLNPITLPFPPLPLTLPKATVTPSPEVTVSPPPSEPQPQAAVPVAPPTIPAWQLGPLSVRLAEINQAVRQSLPIIVRHCGSDDVCRKEQTAAMYELANKERTIAKELRNPTLYTAAVQDNDTVNACKVMWTASEDFAAVMKCINEGGGVPQKTSSKTFDGPESTGWNQH